MKYFTYILKSLKDGKRYIGSTSDLESRLKQHNNGMTLSTQNRRPFEIVCFKEFESKLEATMYERYLKKLKGGIQLNIEIAKMQMPL